MTGHIRRFIESPNEQTQDSFESLFGSGEYKASVLGLTQQDREDALVSAYCENVKKTGRFAFTCSAIVLHPEIDRTHFHLIYATRNRKGVEVFKEAEKKAMEVMETSRAAAQKRTRERKTGTKELFGAEVLYGRRDTKHSGSVTCPGRSIEFNSFFKARSASRTMKLGFWR